MKVINYAGTELVTGDDIAAAVMEYSAALAQESTAVAVEIPVLKDDGTRVMASILIGPASQIVAEHVETGFEELIDDEVVEGLHARRRSLHPVAQTKTAAPTQRDFDSEADGF